ncbi:hypothetical protein, partial [Vibrio campbellii]|uniref:hypothetical protein n=1 Tax=Vibrio campbellii TaxID=680 RepID=UPI001BD929F9
LVGHKGLSNRNPFCTFCGNKIRGKTIERRSAIAPKKVGLSIRENAFFTVHHPLMNSDPLWTWIKNAFK